MITLLIHCIFVHGFHVQLRKHRLYRFPVQVQLPALCSLSSCSPHRPSERLGPFSTILVTREWKARPNAYRYGYIPRLGVDQPR
jgi:hypothetical protein